MTDWIFAHRTLVWWAAALSAATFLATLVIVPMLVVRIPRDYFTHRERHAVRWAHRHAVLRAVLLTGKNALGYLFVLMGIAMLVLPGQGILTIMIGVTLLDFPGKYRLERWLVSRRPVLRSINWLRRCAGREPLATTEDA